MCVCVCDIENSNLDPLSENAGGNCDVSDRWGSIMRLEAKDKRGINFFSNKNITI